MDILYSFIIPHKNSPKLLERCIQSIPYREDIQIIVVDDNSSSDIVNWENLSIINQENVELILNKDNLGAGHARNIGIEHAHGKWLLFPDADDYFLNGFLDILDKYKDMPEDVLFYNVDISPTYGKRLSRYKKALQEFNHPDLSSDKLKFYSLNAPWVRMVKKSMIDKYHIRYEEVLHGNDIFFSFQVGYFAKSIKAESKAIYFYYYNPKSLTNVKHNINKELISIQHLLQANEFRKFIGHPEWNSSLLKRFLSFYKKYGIGYTYQVYKAYRKNRKRIIGNKLLFVNSILQKQKLESHNL